MEMGTPGAETHRLKMDTGQSRGLHRWFYVPWVFFAFIPYLVLSTIILGILASGISVFSPRAAFHCGTLWSWCLCRANFTRVKLRGRRHIKPGQSYIIMCNHQSHFDVLAIYSCWLKQFRWVIKEELRKVPGLGWYCSRGGHIFVDRSNREKAIESLNAARPLLQGGVSVMLFPEGTRSHDGTLGPFKKGGFMLAMDFGLPILPVTITGSGRVLPCGSFRLLPGKITIQIHEPVDVTSFGPEKRDSLMKAVRESIERGLHSREST